MAQNIQKDIHDIISTVSMLQWAIGIFITLFSCSVGFIIAALWGLYGKVTKSINDHTESVGKMLDERLREIYEKLGRDRQEITQAFGKIETIEKICEERSKR